MTGTLGLFSLVDLFQLLAAAKRTGRLSVEHPSGPARIYFDKGQVVHAEFQGQVGEEAVHQLFADERGTFEFRIGIPAPVESIGVSIESLVLDAVRRVDEARRGALEAHAVQKDAVPALPQAAEDGHAPRLTEEEQRLVALVDGRRTVSRIAAELGLPADPVALVFDRLVRTGILKLQNRRARTARLVTRLVKGRGRIAPGSVGLDPSILGAWEKVLGLTVEKVACRREDGTVQLFAVHASQGAGPYLDVTRDTLLRADLRVDEALLVRPYSEEQ